MMRFGPPASFSDHQSRFIRWSVVLLYALITGVVVAHHEPWRDETHTWLLVKLSDSLPGLLANKAYEGHPMLWYLLLYAGNSVANLSVFDAQVLNWLFAVGAVCLLMQFAPFSLPVKILLTFSYFLSYEYAVVARNYAVALLVLVAICSLFPFRHQRWGYCCLCGLVALLVQASAFALAIGATLYAVVLGEVLLHRRWRTPAQFSLYAAGAIVVGAGGLLSVFTILTPPDMGFPDPTRPGHDYAGITSTLAGVWNALVPLPHEYAHFWNTNILDSVDHSSLLKCTLMLGIVGLVILPLFRSRLAMAGWLLTALLMLVVLNQYQGLVRHYGHFLISLLVFLWIQPMLADYGKGQRPGLFAHLSPLANRLWIGLLLVQVAAAGIALQADLTRPFSMNQQVAQYIQSGPMREWPRAGDVDHAVEGIAAFLPEHRMYYPQSSQQNGFIRWTTRRKLLTLDQVVDSVRTQQTGSVLFVSTRPVTPKQADALRLQFIRSFTGSIVADEQYWLYRLDAQVPTLQLNRAAYATRPPRNRHRAPAHRTRPD